MIIMATLSLLQIIGDQVIWFVDHTNPWFVRGSALHVGSGTGVFASSNANGFVNDSVSFRVVFLYYDIRDQIIWFVSFVSPWFTRGYHFYMGSGAGVTAFDYCPGHEGHNGSFREYLL